MYAVSGKKQCRIDVETTNDDLGRPHTINSSLYINQYMHDKTQKETGRLQH